MKAQGKCCFCEKEYNHFGNNPVPILSGKNRCCDECDNRFVIPIRIIEHTGQFKFLLEDLKILKKIKQIKI